MSDKQIVNVGDRVVDPDTNARGTVEEIRNGFVMVRWGPTSRSDIDYDLFIKKYKIIRYDEKGRLMKVCVLCGEIRSHGEKGERCSERTTHKWRPLATRPR